MAKIEDTIAALETKLKQAKALKQKVEARKKSLEQKADRAMNTRRKILVGSFFIQRAESEDQKARLRLMLDGYLKRSDDRALFDLQPLTAVVDQPANPDSSEVSPPHSPCQK
jgi:multidrug resistance efflux pump